MNTLEQFLFILLPGVIAAGGIGEALLHRYPTRPEHGHHARMPGLAGRHGPPRRRVRAHRRSRA